MDTMLSTERCNPTDCNNSAAQSYDCGSDFVILRGSLSLRGENRNLIPFLAGLVRRLGVLGVCDTH
jgi:hypothetical protein